MIRQCEICGKEFKVWPSDVARGRGRWCGAACATKARTRSEGDRRCQYCGKEFHVTPIVVRHGHGIFCCRDCQTASLQRQAIIKGDVAEIPLSRGQIAVVNKEDADLAERTWFISGSGYAARGERCGPHGREKNKTFLMHRVIMERVLGRPLREGESIDHANRNPLDNQRHNLRLATRSQNIANSPKPTTKHTPYYSQYKGVSHCKNGKWKAEIHVNGKDIYLGYFIREEDAARAYDRAALKYFGEFAKPNLPEDVP